jgi:type I restriction enzyme R subunit
MTPEEQARKNIDTLLESAGWIIQDVRQINLGASLGVAVREFPLTTGKADYLLFVDRKAVGVIEAKAEGTTLSKVEEQSGKYTVGLPKNLPHVHLPLPFAYESTGIETYFRDNRDPSPRSRRVFAFHKPETLHELVSEKDTLRSRLITFPPLLTQGLWKPQIEAVTNLEKSLFSVLSTSTFGARFLPCSLIQSTIANRSETVMLGSAFKMAFTASRVVGSILIPFYYSFLPL